jgi:hypothetical protein
MPEKEVKLKDGKLPPDAFQGMGGGTSSALVEVRTALRAQRDATPNQPAAVYVDAVRELLKRLPPSAIAEFRGGMLAVAVNALAAVEAYDRDCDNAATGSSA